MAARMFFTGTVNEGVLEMDDPQRFGRALSDLQGERVLFWICRDRDVRSSAANAYYWGALIPAFMDITGYEKDEAHLYLKASLLEIDRLMPACEDEIGVQVLGETGMRWVPLTHVLALQGLRDGDPVRLGCWRHLPLQRSGVRACGAAADDHRPAGEAVSEKPPEYRDAAPTPVTGQDLDAIERDAHRFLAAILTSLTSDRGSVERSFAAYADSQR